jgi:hypothetical protein
MGSKTNLKLMARANQSFPDNKNKNGYFVSFRSLKNKNKNKNSIL